MNSMHAFTYFKKPWLGGLILFLLAFSLRSCGLSNDLHAGRIYHPDTPKQIRAAERFVVGDYYRIIGGRDYEGYPYFNSHLVALAYRGYDTARQAVTTHLGLPHTVRSVDPNALYWVKRLLNAFLSAMTVVLLYLMGMRFFNRGIGWMAGLMLALSPVDITAAHYATGDSTTSFFATSALFFALAVGKSGCYRHYVAAALLTGAAFSTKYHGGMALISVLVAHLFLYPTPRRLFSKPSIGRAAALGVSLIIGILITSPALLIYPESAFKDILQFVEYTSSFGMTPEMRALPLGSRLALGLRENIPVLADVLGPGVIAALLVTLALAYRQREVWVLAALPAVYILIGLATKPLTHAVYHTLATPALTLLAAMGIGLLFRGRQHPRVRGTVATALLLSALAYSANYSRRELFFYQHNDARYLADTWAHDNIPTSFKLDTRRYTFDVSDWTQDGNAAEALCYVLSGREKPDSPPGTFFSHAVTIEQEKLSTFRNWNLYFFMPDNPAFTQPGYRRAGFQPLPASRNHNLIVSGAPWQIRTPQVRYLSESERIQSTWLAPQPLERMWVQIHAGWDPYQLRMKVGGERRTVQLEPNETRLIRIEQPRPVFLTRNDQVFYRTRFLAEYGSGRIFIATTDSERGWLAFYEGDYEEAYNQFDPERDPIGHLISGVLSGADPEREGLIPEALEAFPSALLDTYGVTPAYLDRLPGITWGRQELLDRHILPVPDEDDPPGANLYLDPGRYILELRFEEGITPVELTVTDPWGDPVKLNAAEETEADATVRKWTVDLDRGHRLIRIRLSGTELDIDAVRELQLRPDIPATQTAYLDFLRMITEDDDSDREILPLHYDLFLALGDRRAAQEKWDLAYTHYQSALAAAPQRRKPYERIQAMKPYLLPESRASAERAMAAYRAAQPKLERHPVSVRLANHMRLTGYEIASRTVRPGGTLRLNLYWETPRLNNATRRHAVWIHGIPEGERHAAFHGDQGLRSVLATPSDQDRLAPSFIIIPVPEDLPVGTYTLKTGIWKPGQRRNIRVRESDIRHDKRGVFITDIEVVE